VSQPANAKAQREVLAAERERQQEEGTVKLMGLVKRVVFEMREHLPAHLDLDDLVSAGTVDLIDAARQGIQDRAPNAALIPRHATCAKRRSV